MNLGRSRNWKPVVAAGIAALAVGAMGAAVTDLSPWYYALRKPAWQPPDWLFGPVWTLIFGLTALAGVSAWRQARDGSTLIRLLALFALNIVLNVLWSWLFFRTQRPDWALVEVAFLWLSILLLMVVLWPVSRLSSRLLLPYLAWVSFAAYLNLVIVKMNGPFNVS